MNHCRIGKVTLKRDFKVVELADHNEMMDSKWYAPLVEAMGLEDVKECLVMIRHNDNGLRYLSNTANLGKRILLIDQMRHITMHKSIFDNA